MQIQMRPNEQALYQGEVTVWAGKLTPSETDAVVTAQRLVLLDKGRTIERGDIAGIKQDKLGLAQRAVFTLRDGSTIAIAGMASDRFLAAVKVLIGQASADSMPREPALSEVKNGTLWLAALGPLLAGFIGAIIAITVWGDPQHWGTGPVLKALAIRIALMYVFLRLDYQSLQRQGFNVARLGIAKPSTFPLYLFSRARAFGKGKGLAITWVVLVAIDILAVLL